MSEHQTATDVWPRVTIGSVCAVNPPRPPLQRVADNTEVTFVPMAAVDEHTGTIVAAQDRTLGEVRAKSYRAFSPGDVLFAKITPCMENGKAVVVPSTASQLGFGSTEFHVMRPGPSIDAQFLWHYVRQERFRSDAEQHMAGSVGQLRVPADFLKEATIPLPPLDEQRAVAALLSGALNGSRAADGHLAAAQRAIERFREAILFAAASGHLTVGWREGHTCSPVAAGPELTLQAKANESGSPNTSDLIDIPSTWAWWSVEGITERVIDYRGRTPPSQDNGPIPHVRTTQIRKGRIDWNTDRFVNQETYDAYMTRGIPRRGDVLFTMEAPMGEVGVIDRAEPFSVAQRILLMRPGDGLAGEFLNIALRSHPVRRAIEYRATGSGVLGVAYKRLRSLMLPKPPMAEQLEIVRRATRLLATADSLEDRIALVEQKLRRNSQALLSKAFRGDLAGVGTSA